MRPLSVTGVVAKAVNARKAARTARWWTCWSHMSARSALTSSSRGVAAGAPPADVTSVIVTVGGDEIVGDQVPGDSAKHQELVAVRGCLLQCWAGEPG